MKMKTYQLDRLIAIAALAAALMLTGFLAVSLFTGGVTAQHFESVDDPASYASRLAASAAPLRAIITLDNLFLIFYSAMFIFLAMRLRNKRNRLLVHLALGALLVTSYLDLYENHTLMMRIDSLAHGLPITAADLQHTAVWSMLKFHSSYLAFFLFAFALPGRSLIEKFLKYSLWFLFPILGIAVYTFPHPLLDLGRYLFMLSGMLLLGWVFWARYRDRMTYMEARRTLKQAKREAKRARKAEKHAHANED